MVRLSWMKTHMFRRVIEWWEFLLLLFAALVFGAYTLRMDVSSGKFTLSPLYLSGSLVSLFVLKTNSCAITITAAIFLWLMIYFFYPFTSAQILEWVSYKQNVVGSCVFNPLSLCLSSLVCLTYLFIFNVIIDLLRLKVLFFVFYVFSFICILFLHYFRLTVFTNPF